MIKIILGRLLQLIPVLWIILTVTFFMSKLVPGGPFSDERQATPEVIAKLNEYYGLDKPLWQQYLAYIEKVARFDFGPSYTYQTDSVNEVIARAFPISLQIGALTFVIEMGVRQENRKTFAQKSLQFDANVSIKQESLKMS